MKMMLRIVAFVIFNFLFFSKAFGCQCCHSGSVFCGGSDTYQNVVLVKVLDFAYVPGPAPINVHEELTVEILQELNGNILEDTLVLWGSDGVSCNGSLIYTFIGDTMLFKLHQYGVYNETNYYETGGCDVKSLYYINDTLKGDVIPNVTEMAYTDFINNYETFETLPDYFKIWGRIFSWSSPETTLNNFNIQINDMPAKPTNHFGRYLFRWVEIIDYDDHVPIVPSSNEDLLLGVSTFDIIKIQKHILNIETLSGPWSLIAADVNNSENISVLDIILLRKALLGINDHFPNNQSWRFVDQQYVFPNPNKPWVHDFDAHIENVDLCDWSEQQNVNLIAIKIGDVDGSHLEDWLDIQDE